MEFKPGDRVRPLTTTCQNIKFVNKHSMVLEIVSCHDKHDVTHTYNDFRNIYGVRLITGQVKRINSYDNSYTVSRHNKKQPQQSSLENGATFYVTDNAIRKLHSNEAGAVERAPQEVEPAPFTLREDLLLML